MPFSNRRHQRKPAQGTRPVPGPWPAPSASRSRRGMRRQVSEMRMFIDQQRANRLRANAENPKHAGDFLGSEIFGSDRKRPSLTHSTRALAAVCHWARARAAWHVMAWHWPGSTKWHYAGWDPVQGKGIKSCGLMSASGPCPRDPGACSLCRMMSQIPLGKALVTRLSNVYMEMSNSPFPCPGSQKIATKCAIR